MSESSENLKKAQYMVNIRPPVHDSRVPHREIIVQLRKTDKWRPPFKPRNKDETEVTFTFTEDGKMPVLITLDDVITSLCSGDSQIQLLGLRQARQLVSDKTDPSINLIIERRIVPICVRFLENPMEILKFEAAWVLTNIVSGSAEQTRCVIEHNAVPQLIALVDSSNLDVSQQALWALGNIAGDGPEARDIIIEHNIIDAILELMSTNKPISFVRTVVWLMSNLCRNKDPPAIEDVSRMLPLLSYLLTGDDVEVLADACWAISYVTTDDDENIDAVIETNAVPRLVNLMGSSHVKVVAPALRAVGNIVAGSDRQTDEVIRAGALPKLCQLLRNPKQNIVKEATWAVSNIAACTETQIEAVMEAGIFHQIRWLLVRGDPRTQREAAWVVTNMGMSGAAEQVVDIMQKCKILKPFMKLIYSEDYATVEVVEAGLINLFAAADVLGETEKLCQMVRELGCLGKIVELRSYEHEEISRQADFIISTYYKKLEARLGQREDR